MTINNFVDTEFYQDLKTMVKGNRGTEKVDSSIDFQEYPIDFVNFCSFLLRKDMYIY